MDMQIQPKGIKGLNIFLMLGVGLLALIVYSITLSKGIFPGESAWLVATYTGLEPLEIPAHPIWGALVKWVGDLSFLSLPVRLNFISALCTILSVMLIFRVVSFFINDIITEEYSLDFAPYVARFAGVVAAVTFLFSAPVWQAATRLQYQSFDLLLLLLAIQ
jgi:hypothetical protein